MRRGRQRGLGVTAGLAAVAAVIGLGGSPDPQAAIPPLAPLAAQPVTGLPVKDLVPFGAATTEGEGTIWGYGHPTSGPPGVVELAQATGGDGVWSSAGPPRARDGSPMTSFRLAAAVPSGDRALAAQMTPRGGGLLVGTDAAADDAQVLITRDPGKAFQAIPAPAAAPSDDDPASRTTPASTATPATTTAPANVLPDDEAATSAAPAQTTAEQAEADRAVGDDPLAAGETLYPAADSRLPTAPIDEGDHTGVLIAPATSDDEPQSGVLHWDGSAWTREPITAPSAATDLRVVALGASSRGNAWLLASSAAADRPLMLFQRTGTGAGETPEWVLRTDPSSPLLGTGGGLGAGISVAAGATGQPLTVTDNGVWVDGTAAQGAIKSDLTFLFAPSDGGHVVASWCEVAALCTHSLGRDRTDREYRSSAWAGDGGDQLGARIVTGYGDSIVRRLDGSTFVTVLGTGDAGGWTGGAAFMSPNDGWIGGDPLVHVTAKPVADQVQSWPVPFRRPLLAIASEPGKPVADFGARALAVGDDGQVARYDPATGWRPESLVGANGRRATPRLRGVAWPVASFAYAVGDNGEMWRWRRATGLWEPDPAKPRNFETHLNAIAFDPRNPGRGYAVGKDGSLLRYDKSWTQEVLPAGLERVQFTAIAFAGSEAMVAYRYNNPDDVSHQLGGLLVNDGGGWHADTEVAGLLEKAGGPLRVVAALPDGGAVAAGPQAVLERDGPGRPWRTAPQPLAGVIQVTAVAAVRDGDAVRAVLSVDPGIDDIFQAIDVPATELPAGAPPFQSNPDPLPATGQLLRETAAGWRDEQHAAHYLRLGPSDAQVPVRPDSVLALALSPDGSAGWVVGGETSRFLGSASSSQGAAVQTAGVARYPPATRTPPGTATAAITAGNQGLTFAIGGGAQCEVACAALVNTVPTPDISLQTALTTAARTGARGFLYTGSRLAPGVASQPAERPADEFARYGDLIRSAGAFPVFPAAAPSDADAAGSTAAFGDAVAPFGSRPAPDGFVLRSRTPAGSAKTYYAFDSTGPQGTARVIVVDYSAPALDAAQLCWLAGGLGDAQRAGVPAIVLGARSLAPQLADAATDATAVGALLAGGVTPAACPGVVAGRASAYFFEAKNQTRQVPIVAGGQTMPSFGSGTLGYTTAAQAADTEDFTASGFLLATLDPSRRDPATNQVPVTVRLVPSITELGVDATDGTLLRRSQPALFAALARRPRGGLAVAGGSTSPNPYVPVPARCLGARCATFVAPEYSFASSNPDVADFVKQDPASSDPRAVLLGPGDKPIADSSSGLLCAYNGGTTTVTVTAGGLSYSAPVTVQSGSVRRPCGTVPLKEPPARAGEAAVPDLVEPSQPAQEPSSPASPPATFPPPAAPAPAPAPAPQAAPAPPVLPLFGVPGPPFGVTQLTPALPTTPPVAQPTPPSGTAQVNVTQPVSQTASAPERQREEEEAIEMVHHMSAYDARSRQVVPPYTPVLLLLAALAGGGAYRGLRRRHVHAYIDESTNPHINQRSRS